MPGIKIEIKGLDGLRKKLYRLPVEAMAEFQEALIDEATQMMSLAQEKVPVRTGRLRSSARVTGERGGRFKHAIVLAYDAPYAIYVHAKEHWATGERYAPTHWLQRAVEKRNKGLAGRLVRRVRNVLAKKFPGLSR